MSSDKGADDVLYIEHGDFTVCTCGARQSLYRGEKPDVRKA